MKPFAGRRRLAISRYHRDMPDETSPLFVRLPRREADLLDRAAFEGRTSKRELVTTMVKRYLDEKPPQPELVLGRAELRPASAPDVLTIDQAAALLQVEPAEVEALAEAGELPGRQIGDGWRFPRAALLEWLAAR
jgi:excisionase family DNA binding protein